MKKIALGAKYEIVGFNKGNPDYRKKLLAMGLTVGTVFTITHIAPLGDPIEINFRASSLIIRKNEAKILKLKAHEKADHGPNRQP
jgi:ferrous iron transport protein A